MLEQQQTIIQIVPRLPPAIDGVGDRSLLCSMKFMKLAIDTDPRRANYSCS